MSNDYLDTNQAVDASLVRWCLEHGVAFGPITSGFVPNGWRGVIATADIDPDTCILQVPRSILLSTESASKDEHLQAAIKATGAVLQPVQVLAIHLLHQISKGSNSFWHIYLRTLPPSYTTAISLTSSQAAALQLPYAQRQIAQAIESAEQLYTTARPVLNALQLDSTLSSKSTFFWALSTLASRTMFFPKDDGGCLTPFGDLHNYAPPPPPFIPSLATNSNLTNADSRSTASDADDSAATMWGDGSLDPGTDMYCLYARKAVHKGDEVFLCYGRHTNLELLEHYGFVLADNPHDIAVLSLKVVPEAVSRQLHPKMGAGEAVIHANGNPSWEMLRALRLAALTSGQRKLNAWLALEDKKVSDDSELWAMKTLKEMCVEMLQSLPTTLEEDEEEIQRGGLAEGMLVVVQWRLGYKKCLDRAIKLSEAVIKELQGSERAIDSMAADIGNLNIRQPKFLVRRPPPSKSVASSS